MKRTTLHFATPSTPAFDGSPGADPDDNISKKELTFCVYDYGVGGAEAAWVFPVETVRAAFSALVLDVPAL
jgi:hypothetical protein